MASTADNTVSIVSSVGLNPRCAEALPIHDGFIVQKRYEALLVQAMTDAFEEMFHVVPKIKWSDSPLRVFSVPATGRMSWENFGRVTFENGVCARAPGAIVAKMQKSYRSRTILGVLFF